VTDQRALGDLSFAATVWLFARLSPALACQDAQLPHEDIDWAPRAWTFRDYARLRRLPSTLPRTEIDRRIRCASGDLDRPIELQSGDDWYGLRLVQAQGV
jgi:hypothetical protein